MEEETRPLVGTYRLRVVASKNPLESHCCVEDGRDAMKSSPLMSPVGKNRSLLNAFGLNKNWCDAPTRLRPRPRRRWHNLWIPIWEDPEDPDRGSNNVDEEDFLGNTVIVAFVGLLILVLHVLVVSAVEVNWLQASKVSCFKRHHRSYFALMRV